MGQIQKIIFNVLRNVSKSQKAIEELSSETKTASEEVESAETELGTTETEIEAVEAEITTAEEALAGAGRLKDLGGAVDWRW